MKGLRPLGGIKTGVRVCLLLEGTASLAQGKLGSAPSERYKERKTRDNRKVTVGSPGAHAALVPIVKPLYY